MMINIVFYAVASALSGLAPTFQVFLILRMMFGIGMGGQWGVSASLALESISPKWRGMISGMLHQGYSLGNLLAALAFLTVYPAIHASHPEYAWRVMFFIGGSAGAALHLCAEAGEGVRGVAGASHRLAQLRAVTALDLAALSLPGADADGDGLYFSRHAGSVPHIPDAAAEILAAGRGFDHHGIDGGRDPRGTGDRLFLRSFRTPPRHDRLRALRAADYSAVDRRARGPRCWSSAAF